MALQLIKEELPQIHEETSILHFSLEGILPPHQTLALDPTTKVLMLLSLHKERPQILCTHLLTSGEYYVLLPLLDTYPYFCPYETILASYRGRATETAITIARQHLHAALETGTWDQVMRPARSALSRLRLKLRLMNLETASIFSTGYILQATQWTTRKRETEAGRS